MELKCIKCGNKENEYLDHMVPMDAVIMRFFKCSNPDCGVTNLVEFQNPHVTQYWDIDIDK